MFRAIVFTVISFIALDVTWVYCIAAKMYKNTVPDLLRMKDGAMAAQMLPALMFYVIALFCLIVLVVKPTATVSKAAINGALIGLFSYGTYALTCQSIYKGWTWSLVIPDVLWGVILCAASCAIGVYFKS